MSLVEMLPHLLLNSFDREFSQLVEDKLRKKGVNIITGVRVKEITGNGEVKKVKLSDGKVIQTEGVILGLSQIQI